MKCDVHVLQLTGGNEMGLKWIVSIGLHCGLLQTWLYNR